MRAKITNMSRANQGVHFLAGTVHILPNTSHTGDLDAVGVREAVKLHQVGLIRMRDTEDDAWAPEITNPAPRIPEPPRQITAAEVASAQAAALELASSAPPVGVTEEALQAMEDGDLKQLVKDKTGAAPRGNPSRPSILTQARAAVGLPEPAEEPGEGGETDDVAFKAAQDAGFPGDLEAWVAAGRPKPAGSGDPPEVV